MEQQAENDFDALINLEGGGSHDMFSPDKQAVYAEMNMAWLNGMNDDYEDENENEEHGHDYETSGDVAMFECGNEKSKAEQKSGDLDADLGVWS